MAELPGRSTKLAWIPMAAKPANNPGCNPQKTRELPPFLALAGEGRPRQIQGSATRSVNPLTIVNSLIKHRFGQESKGFGDLGMTSVYIRASR
jgi:hypothetical protein